ncbi:TetR/AcrR family transcriptional regulator [Gordonia sinesedis]
MSTNAGPNPAPDHGASDHAGRRGPRDRMIRHAALLIGRHGVGATSIGDVLAASDAPRGSIYHHFPGGRTQLMSEAVQHAGNFIAGRLDDQRSGSVRTAVFDICNVWRRLLIDSDYRFGCPVLAGGLARDSEPTIADEAEAILAHWRRIIADRLIAEDLSADRAESLATVILAAAEGAIALAQIERSIEPFDRVVTELAALCETAATSN